MLIKPAKYHCSHCKRNGGIIKAEPVYGCDECGRELSENVLIRVKVAVSMMRDFEYHFCRLECATRKLSEICSPTKVTQVPMIEGLKRD